jgi:hypothetical protein
MRARTITSIGAIAAVTLACTSATAGAATGRAATPGARQAADSCTTWQTVAAPVPPGFTSPASSDSAAFVSSVSVLPGQDVLFNGTDFAHGVFEDPWLLRWNGRSVSMPSQVSNVPSLEGTLPYGSGSFDSGNDGWILRTGQSLDQFDPDIAMAEHWTGGHWTLTPMAVSPDPAHKGIRFNDIAAVSPDNAWAVGALYAVGPGNLFGLTAVGALIEHWDGTSWSIVPNPAAGQRGAVLNGISVVSPSDIWVAGQQGNPDQASQAERKPFIEHWNGSTWSIVAVPAVGSSSWLEGVSGDSGTDAWAVGYHAKSGTSTFVPLIEHWNGTSWTAVSLAATLTGLNGLVSVYAASPDDVWATEGGAQYVPDGVNAVTAPNVFLHWDGSTWTTVPGPGPREDGLGYTYLAIAGSGPGNVWAVGTVTLGYPSGDQYPLIARLGCG